MTPEGRVKKKVNELLKASGVWYFTPVSNGMGTHGIPDKICCVPVKVTAKMVGRQLGLFLAIETKRDATTTPTKRQEMQLKSIRDAGGMAILVNNERLPSLETLLTILTAGSSNDKSSGRRRKESARRKRR